MPGTRLKPLSSIPVKDNDMDRVQKNLMTALSGVIASPTLDSQILTGPIQSQTTAQTLTLNHNLGRVPSGLHVVSCSGLVAAIGNQVYSSTSVTFTFQLMAAATGTISVVIF